jgi:hypothetical protein
VSPVVYSEGFPDFVRSIFRTSLGKGIVRQLIRSELGEVAIRRAWHNQYAIPESVIENYKKIALCLNWHEGSLSVSVVLLLFFSALLRVLIRSLSLQLNHSFFPSFFFTLRFIGNGCYRRSQT